MVNSIADFLEVPSNAKIVSTGQHMNFIPFVKKGCVRVFIENNDIDKEQLLYYVNGGETWLGRSRFGLSRNRKTNKDPRSWRSPPSRFR